ncbi:divalent cation tolerance protein CutA [Hymenobacter sp. BT664]|uniref:Divalent cation tolerance protein CutA n=1 Tax=Hymenobacter montanus TaxID=2771359 RepID=A0A927GJB3_9BACT|nr:divalent cation tolerance protein CutA [Hymenobacter montanus]MBD2767936.1 divalent cation tolerance protein CutA [Hymenobacter montanus]
MDVKLIVFTCSPDVADQITIQAAEHRLASQIYELPVGAHYLWSMPPRVASGVTLVMITRSDLSDELYEIILELCAPELAAIVSLPIEDVHKPYVKWMARYLAH